MLSSAKKEQTTDTHPREESHVHRGELKKSDTKGHMFPDPTTTPHKGGGQVGGCGGLGPWVTGGTSELFVGRELFSTSVRAVPTLVRTVHQKGWILLYEQITPQSPQLKKNQDFFTLMISTWEKKVHDQRKPCAFAMSNHWKMPFESPGHVVTGPESFPRGPRAGDGVSMTSHPHHSCAQGHFEQRGRHAHLTCSPVSARPRRLCSGSQTQPG